MFCGLLEGWPILLPSLRLRVNLEVPPFFFPFPWSVSSNVWRGTSLEVIAKLSLRIDSSVGFTCADGRSKIMFVRVLTSPSLILRRRREDPLLRLKREFDSWPSNMGAKNISLFITGNYIDVRQGKEELSCRWIDEIEMIRIWDAWCTKCEVGYKNRIKKVNEDNMTIKSKLNG